jgi:hypothetical protein
VPDVEHRVTEQMEPVQVMSDMAEVSKGIYALEQLRDLQNTRGRFFGFVVSVAVLAVRTSGFVADAMMSATATRGPHRAVIVGSSFASLFPGALSLRPVLIRDVDRTNHDQLQPPPFQLASRHPGRHPRDGLPMADYAGGGG